MTCKDAECHFQLLYFTHKHETNFLSLIYFRYHVPTTYKRVEVSSPIRKTFAHTTMHFRIRSKTGDGDRSQRRLRKVCNRQAENCMRP